MTNDDWGFQSRTSNEDTISPVDASLFGTYNYEYPAIGLIGYAKHDNVSKSTSDIASNGAADNDNIDNYYYNTKNARENLPAIKNEDSAREIEREIQEELSNEISLLELEPSFASPEERAGDEDGDQQKRGLCGVGARYRSVRCVRDDDVIVHSRYVAFIKCAHLIIK